MKFSLMKYCNSFIVVFLLAILVVIYCGHTKTRIDYEKMAEYRFSEAAILPAQVRIPEFELREVYRL